MKKLIALLACAFMAFALVSCGDGDKNKTENAETEPLEIEDMVTEEYSGVLDEVQTDELYVEGDAGIKKFSVSENTVYDLGGCKHVLAGDSVGILYQEEEGENVAQQVTLITKAASPGDFAANLCWPYGEAEKGSYGSGQPTDEYAALLEKLRPHDSSTIASEQWNAGASCDIFVATVMRGMGLLDFPVTLSGQCDYFFISERYKNDFDKIETYGAVENMEHGDIGIYIREDSENNGQGHIFVVNKTDDHSWRSNAHYRIDGGYYGVTDDLDNFDPGKYKYFGVFRLKD
ncbi:MAG: hypothetical protein Q4A65_00925 [Bacillota bacterium]|nr:hypothetical protein [Bacillota bacterium]